MQAELASVIEDHLRDLQRTLSAEGHLDDRRCA